MLGFFNVDREVQEHLNRNIRLAAVVVHINISLKLEAVSDNLQAPLRKRLHKMHVRCVRVIDIRPQRESFSVGLLRRGVLGSVASALTVGPNSSRIACEMSRAIKLTIVVTLGL